MKPILYGATDKSFTTQGLGTLSEAISCKVTEERNGSYELEMVYPQSGKRFKDLLLNRIIKAVPAYRKDAEPFRIYYISKPLNGKVTVKAEHISYQLSYIPVKPFTANNVVEAMDNLKKYSAEDNPFTFWTSKETIAKMYFDVPTSCRALLGGTSGSILDTYLGEYEFNSYTVKLHDHRGVDKGFTIRYGKNLTDITQEESIANTITGICPYWKSEETGEVVTLPETTISSDKANNFPFKRTVPHDFTASFEEKPTEAQLREKAEAYVKQTGFGVPEVSIDVSFVLFSQFEGYENLALLEAVNLCDTVSVYFEPLEISTKAKVIKTVYNVLTDTYDSITLGSAKNSLTKVMEDIKQDTDDKIVEETNARKKAIAELVKKVEAGKGLYLTDKGEDGAHDWFLHDKPELADSQTIIRINDGGMIFSVDGGKSYNGLSWDGTAMLKKIYAIGIDANYINAGELNAAIVKIKNLHLQDISDGKGVTLDATLNGITADVSAKYTELDGKISDNSASISMLPDSITSTVKKSYIDPLTGRVSSAESDIDAAEERITQTEKDILSTKSSITQTASSITADVSAKYKELDGKISSNTSSISMLPDSITSTVKKSYIDPLDTRVSEAETSIKLNAETIESKVSKGSVISTINQSAEKITISADKIDFDGSVTFSNTAQNASDALSTAKSASSTASAASATADNASKTASSASTSVSNLSSGLSSGTTKISGDCITTGKIKIGAESYINTGGSFKLGSMQSVGELNNDVEFKHAIFVDYGIELLAGNDGATPYIDFHTEATDHDSGKYDYTARIQNTQESWISFYGKSDGTNPVEACTVQAGQFRGTFVNVSDARLKSDIEELNIENVLSELMQYRPVSYKYVNGVDTNIHHGLIAQEAKEVSKWGLVDDRGQYLAVCYTELVADLIAAVQYAVTEIGKLKAVSNENKKETQKEGEQT